MTCLASASSVSLTFVSSTASAISACDRRPRPTNSVSSESASPLARTRQRLSRPRRTKRPSAARLRLAHRLEQQDVRTALRLARSGDEVVVAVEVDRIDRLTRTKLRISIERKSSDRSIASRSASSTMTNWPFATSEPRTISSCVTSRSYSDASSFCLIGSHARGREQAEGDVRLSRSGLRRRTSPTGSRRGRS